MLILIFVLVITCLYCSYLFFFFQAEDGIRDSSVTGVQTCALPIWAVFRRAGRRLEENHGCGPREGWLHVLTALARRSFVERRDDQWRPTRSAIRRPVLLA